jgi:hypothetical protein
MERDLWLGFGAFGTARRTVVWAKFHLWLNRKREITRRTLKFVKKPAILDKNRAILTVTTSWLRWRQWGENRFC